MATEWVGWASALILAITLSSQVYTQWRTRSCAGVSRWLFIGQLFASIGFVTYSVLVDNLVFVMTNSFNVCAALIGQWIYLKNKNAGRDAAVNQAGNAE